MSRSVHMDYDTLRAREAACAARLAAPAAPDATTPDTPAAEGEGATHV